MTKLPQYLEYSLLLLALVTSVTDIRTRRIPFLRSKPSLPTGSVTCWGIASRASSVVRFFGWRICNFVPTAWTHIAIGALPRELSRRTAIRPAVVVAS